MAGKTESDLESVTYDLERDGSEGYKYEPDLVVLYAAHYADHRHMHTMRWGRAKPRFRLVDGVLKLENSPVQRPTIPEPQSAQLDAANLRNPEFKHEMEQLGAAIVRALRDDAENDGAEFLLIVQYERSLVELLDGDVRILDVQPALDHPNFSLPGGLGHLNPKANAVLAWEIARFIKEHGLYPSPKSAQAATP